MPNYNKGGMSDAPGQVNSPDSASKPFITDKDGVVYPRELKRTANEYLDSEGSNSFERNQGVVRDGWGAPDVELGTMGQSKLQRLKAGGSHAI